MICILCESQKTKTFQTRDQLKYWRCATCEVCFMDPECRLNADIERERYLLHQTKSIDEGYRKFVGPLIEAIKQNCRADSRGLDYGAGHQPVLAELLNECGFKTEIYDPFFWPNQDVLNAQYDFVTACEVVEHFFNPREEFAKLRKLTKPGGVLVINTEPCAPEDKFESWYYRRDPSHVVFYSKPTFIWIAREFGFTQASYEGRVAVLT